MSKYYDDDYEGENFEKFTHRKEKSHRKGHQSRSANSEKRKWGEMVENDYIPPMPTPKPAFSNNPHYSTNRVESPAAAPSQPVEHQFGPNTHEIKGVKIDFDGVAGIEKVENTKDGQMTYGIKFLFKGRKGLYRTIWFNVNMRARDSVYNTEYGFWLSLQQKQEEETMLNLVHQNRVQKVGTHSYFVDSIRKEQGKADSPIVGWGIFVVVPEMGVVTVAAYDNRETAVKVFDIMVACETSGTICKLPQDDDKEVDLYHSIYCK